MEKCVDGYSSAYKLYLAQNKNFINALNDIKLNGGDIYKSLDVWTNLTSF